MICGIHSPSKAIVMGCRYWRIDLRSSFRISCQPSRWRLQNSVPQGQGLTLGKPRIKWYRVEFFPIRQNSLCFISNSKQYFILSSLWQLLLGLCPLSVSPSKIHSTIGSQIHPFHSPASTLLCRILMAGVPTSLRWHHCYLNRRHWLAP